MDKEMYEVKSVFPMKNFHLLLEFTNGEYRVVDLRPFLKKLGPMNEPLTNPDFFKKVKIDPDLKTVVWENGMDFCPDVLYAKSVPITLPESINS
ncbi:DUF2442 domain-containing protein [Microaerobacter geothermalis]|uniref:DUF2442 domain-containing protein n=1 Tax=Microaerobacter geothermalis TaxID=674972 RepID=UPI001F1A0065|nr:DUF2442 domain-containing protein [Microaerobacter geothermalis]MCF6095086.1 DUF2442 domain-containing protein [Microaerobacter geothermalis]